MDPSIYEAEAAVEASHWWFEGRRRLFGRILERYAVKPESRILDAGTGTGANLRMLMERGYANALGLDFSPDAISFCVKKGLSVRLGSLTEIPFEDRSLDFVLATDVIEHLDDDVGALAEIRRVLRPGGRVLITVPAFQSLWGYNDDRAHHKRRYRLPQLRERLADSDLHICEIFYFNYILFVPIWLARLAAYRFAKTAVNESELNSPSLNAVLLRLFKFDTWTAERIHPPFGVSILAVAERRDQASTPGAANLASTSTCDLEQG
jgi:SAM-dependent methyltransferase